jgi:ADP-ribose pyrophosphatase
MTRHELLKTKNFVVCEAKFRFNNLGDQRRLTYIEQPPVAIAVPVLPDGRLVMVEHWRPLLGVTLLECPGGKIDAADDSIEAGLRRELAEEIGYEIDVVESLGGFYSSVGISTEEIYCYVARGLRPVTRKSSDKNRMNIVLLTEAEVRGRMQETPINDGKTVVAINRYLGGV